ncbi:peptide methionine sulfoxide reductase [Nonlabens antarcticus]|uniref:peptide methionine sulfoxide reductase n=1 Tax=Nonlabens antarcticus TaxID=392714 RepID=UPI001890FDD6|nr:peptide methionine sulfoxide reductase [Nonlabens antarcticus]
MTDLDLKNSIDLIPLGYSTAIYIGKKYGVTKELFNNGRSVKVYAEELGGKDFISFNYYEATGKNYLKPCEMPVETVTDFLTNFLL